jgi:hypothetical protein
MSKSIDTVKQNIQAMEEQSEIDEIKNRIRSHIQLVEQKAKSEIRIEVAKMMLKQGFDFTTIHEITELPLEEVQDLE